MSSSSTNEFTYDITHVGAWAFESPQNAECFRAQDDSSDIILEPHPDASGVYAQGTASILTNGGANTSDATSTSKQH
jgi:hypothetical protein